MFSKINHVAIVSENYAVLEQFYRAVFGMTSSAKTRPGRAVTVGDGYVGLNINPRRAGRRPGLDHFGIEVADAETAFDRMRRNYPEGKANPRHINHVAMRAMRPDAMAAFYRDVFELAPANRPAEARPDDKNHYLTDGHMTLVIMPWDIADYEGTGIITAGMDHIGFKVEDMTAFRQDVQRGAADKPPPAP